MMMKKMHKNIWTNEYDKNLLRLKLKSRHDDEHE